MGTKMSDKERKKNAISPDRGLPLATPDGLVQYQDFETPLGRKAPSCGHISWCPRCGTDRRIATTSVEIPWVTLPVSGAWPRQQPCSHVSVQDKIGTSQDKGNKPDQSDFLISAMLLKCLWAHSSSILFPTHFICIHVNICLDRHTSHRYI